MINKLKPYILFFSLLIIKPSYSDILPNDKLSAEDVVNIQLTSLKENDKSNKGIYQCWLFAHPENKKYTGPLENFIIMIKSNPYDVLLKTNYFKIKLISQSQTEAKFEVILDTNSRNRYRIFWSLSRTTLNNECKNCWMTIGVTRPNNLGPII